ncbi:MAG: FG-GAP repeat protein, partial [Thermoplasmata archaeon]|nr:FG-GAP repeat protein [Thermoplasmata archaeon]
MTTKRLVVSIVIILFLLSPIINFDSTPPSKTSEFQLNNYSSYSTSGSSSRSRGTMLDLNNNADVTLFGVDRKDYSGDTLWTGDINGDNVDELLVGTPWASNLAGNVSVIYTTFKSQFDLEQDAELIIKGKNPFAAQDHIAVCTGDIDGDGKEDMIMGACY